MSAEPNPHRAPADFDVARWLEKIRLGQYAEAFAENEINSVALPLLTEEDLKACGVLVLGHRKIILHEIQKLKEGAAAAAESAAKSAPVAPAPTTSLTPIEVPTLRGPNRPAPSDEICTEIVFYEHG